MRNAFAKKITSLAAENDSLVLLSGDIGNRLFDEYKQLYPSRFYNCGVAEQSMIGLASGLASLGFHPITYTIAPFNTIRCLEQIKLDICYSESPVILVGTGAGLSYAGLGPTHHSLEDLAITRAIPNLNIVCPADSIEVTKLLPQVIDSKRPTYFRLGKKGEPDIHKEVPINLIIGEAFKIKSGEKICLLAVGNMVATALEVSTMLEELGIVVEVYSFHTICPLDKKTLAMLFSQKNLVVTIEEHFSTGGFGSSVAEWLSQENLNQRASHLICGAEHKFVNGCGDQKGAREDFGISSAEILRKIKARLSSI